MKILTKTGLTICITRALGKVHCSDTDTNQYDVSTFNWGT
jgi:hypothetical protein